MKVEGSNTYVLFLGSDFWGKRAKKKDLTSDKVPASCCLSKAIGEIRDCLPLKAQPFTSQAANLGKVKYLYIRKYIISKYIISFHMSKSELEISIVKEQQECINKA